ncbi:Sodium- and chloride-dependent creatine transporter 1 [Mactra antiquata]
MEEVRDYSEEDGLSQDRNSSGMDSKDSTKQRQTWSSQLDFIMTSIGCAVGLGNIWRFPFLCYKNGGGAFLVPYLLTFFFVAAPAYIAEISLGQYMSSGTVRAWKIAPVFQGLGFASQIILMYTNVYYIVVVAWALYYIAASFTSDLPWASCSNPWNTERCFVTGMVNNRTILTANCSNTSALDTCVTNNGTLTPVDAVQEYWERHVLRMSDGIDTPGSLVPGLVLALFVAWVLAYLCICKGVKWTGKVVYFTALVPYVLLTTLFIRAATLEGATDGLIYYLKPDFSRLIDAQVWLDGATQVIYSIGLGFGFMISLGSYNKFNNNCVRNGFIVICINGCTSLFGGLTVFATLGFMSNEMNVPIDKVASQGPGLVFLTYPKAVTQMPLSPLWSVLFFMTILFVGLDSQFASVEAFVTPILDRWPRTLYKSRNRMLIVGLYCVVSFLAGLLLVTEGGIYIFRLIDYYCVSGLLLLAMVFFEAVTLGWVFGAERFYDALELMTGNRPGPWLKICWKYLTPFIINVIFWFQLVTFKPLQFSETYEYPAWSTILGILGSLSSIMLVPLVAGYKVVKTPGSIKERLKRVSIPILKKHQIYSGWMSSGYKWVLQKYDRHDVNNPFNIDDSIDEQTELEYVKPSKSQAS